MCQIRKKSSFFATLGHNFILCWVTVQNQEFENFVKVWFEKIYFTIQWGLCLRGADRCIIAQGSSHHQRIRIDCDGSMVPISGASLQTLVDRLGFCIAKYSTSFEATKPQKNVSICCCTSLFTCHLLSIKSGMSNEHTWSRYFLSVVTSTCPN